MDNDLLRYVKANGERLRGLARDELGYGSDYLRGLAVDAVYLIMVRIAKEELALIDNCTTELT